jgi:hypothetical protein
VQPGLRCLCARQFGGLDILVANAGIASSASIEDTTVEMWRKNYDVLAEGYFLTARAAFPDEATAAAAPSCSSAPRTDWPPRPTRRPTPRPRRRHCTSRAASHWRARHTASASTPSIPTPSSAARASGTATGARSGRRPRHRRRGGTGGALPQALAAQTRCAARGCRRGGTIFAERSVGQIDRQHAQRGCRQCPGVHPLTTPAGPVNTRQHPITSDKRGNHEPAHATPDRADRTTQPQAHRCTA